MKHLNTQPNFGTPGERHRHAYTPGDDFYDLLIAGHAGLSDAQSDSLNARLVLLLANHIGDLRVLREAIAAARPDAASTALAAASAAEPEEPPP
jgi:hypothetical protein